jgi:broad specificity phosphatase PhoE
MATIFMVRHASHSLLNRVLAGRQVDVPLSAAGWQEAEALAETVSTSAITHIHSSPRRRAYETARALGRRLKLPIDIVPALDEVDFGEWAGRSFTDLDGDALWARWNNERSGVRAPGGERMEDVLSRVMEHLWIFSKAHPDGRVLMVTHAEVIRALILTRMGLPLNGWQSVDVAPASITRFCLRSQHGSGFCQHEERV